jgi:hypothetical protein
VLGLAHYRLGELAAAKDAFLTSVTMAPLFAAGFRMLGQIAAAETLEIANLTMPLPANGPRAHYMRAMLEAESGTPPTMEERALFRYPELRVTYLPTKPPPLSPRFPPQSR